MCLLSKSGGYVAHAIGRWMNIAFTEWLAF